MAVGTPADLTLLTEFGVMPVSGHWHMRHRVDRYLEHRAQEVDATEPDVHMLTPDRAVEEWKRLEPAAIGHERAALHDFFGRTRKLPRNRRPRVRPGHGAVLGERARRDGPGRGEEPGGPRPRGPRGAGPGGEDGSLENLRRALPTASWWLMDRLRRLGFRVHWPAWIMSSIPLPGLDRYLPTRP